MRDHQDLQSRLREVMTHMEWEHADVVRVSRQSSSVVSQWLGKSSKIIKTIGKMEAAQALAAASGYEALWIAKGQGPKRRPKASPATASTPFSDEMTGRLHEQPPAVIDWIESVVGQLLSNPYQNVLPLKRSPRARP